MTTLSSLGITVRENATVVALIGARGGFRSRVPGSAIKILAICR